MPQPSMYKASARTAIPVFVFLALILLFVPAAVLILIKLRRRHQQRAQDTKDEPSQLETGVELPEVYVPKFPSPPQAVAIKPIRGMSSGRNNRPLPPITISKTYNPHPGHLIQQDGPGPEIPSTPTYTYDYPRIRNLTHEQTHFPTTPTYTLPTAFSQESSPATIGSVKKKRISITDAPRVKSCRVSPERSHTPKQDILEESLYPKESVPSIESLYFRGDGREQSRWV